MTESLATDIEVAEFAGQLFFRLWRASHTRTAAALDSIGLSPPLFAILNVLGAREGSIQQQLSSDMGIDPSAMVKLINELDDAGLAERRRRPGDICLTTRRIGFAERAVTSEVTHVDAPRTWGVRGIDGPIRATVNVTVAPLDEGRHSRVQIELEFVGRGIGKLLVPIAVRDARKEMPANLQRLKERLEHQR